MKNKTISLSDEMHTRIKSEANASHLIDRLLRDYYKSADITTLSEEEIRRRIKILEIKEDADRKIKEVGEQPLYGN